MIKRAIYTLVFILAFYILLVATTPSQAVIGAMCTLWVLYYSNKSLTHVSNYGKLNTIKKRSYISWQLTQKMQRKTQF